VDSEALRQVRQLRAAERIVEVSPLRELDPALFQGRDRGPALPSTGIVEDQGFVAGLRERHPVSFLRVARRRLPGVELMRIRAALAGLVLLSLLTPDLAAGVTEYLDEFRAAAADRRAEILPDLQSEDKKVRKAAKKVVKAFDQIFKKLDGKSASKGYPQEMSAASFAAKKFTTTLRAEKDLFELLNDAELAYFADILAARGDVLTAANNRVLDEKTRLKARKTLIKGDKKIAKIGRVASLYLRLKKSAAAAKVFEPDTDVGPVPGDGVATWVVREFALAPSGMGFDLDGDGLGDNALGSAALLLTNFGLDINAIVNKAIKQAGTFVIVRMWNIDDWHDDTSVMLGLAPATDGDEDPDNNFGGSGVFDASPDLDPDGHPSLRAPTVLQRGGTFVSTFTGEDLGIGDLELPDSALLSIAGVAREGTTSGFLAVPLPFTLVVDLLEAEGVTVDGSIRTALESVQDVDLDGDGTDDALSLSLIFTAVPCTLE
jgi:hypothetical protein